jgi:hypothetical protein
MEFFSSKFVIYLYSVLAVVVLILGVLFLFLRKKFGNVLFLTNGEVTLGNGKSIKILKILPFMGEGYLLFVKLSTSKGERIEIWGFTKNGGFKKISEL